MRVVAVAVAVLAGFGGGWVARAATDNRPKVVITCPAERNGSFFVRDECRR